MTTHAMNDGVVKLARELDPTVVRFPGGTFADFYHWQDGTGAFETPALGWVQATKGVPWLVVTCARSKSCDAHPGVAPVTHPAAKWAEPAGDGKNARIRKGGEDEIWLKESEAAGVAADWTYRFPARSVTVIRLSRREK